MKVTIWVGLVGRPFSELGCTKRVQLDGKGDTGHIVIRKVRLKECQLVIIP
jgi:hypothetical protein